MAARGIPSPENMGEYPVRHLNQLRQQPKRILLQNPLQSVHCLHAEYLRSWAGVVQRPSLRYLQQEDPAPSLPVLAALLGVLPQNVAEVYSMGERVERQKEAKNDQTREYCGRGREHRRDEGERARAPAECVSPVLHQPEHLSVILLWAISRWQSADIKQTQKSIHKFQILITKTEQVFLHG